MTDLLTIYETYLRSNRRIRSHKTDERYRLALKQFASAIGKRPKLSDLTDDSIVQLEKSLDGRSAETINHTTGRIKALWRWCCKRGLVSVWPTIDRLPVPEPYRRAWHVEELRQLVAACELMRYDYGGVPARLWWRAWHIVQFDIAERTGAMLKLRWEWITPRGLDIPLEARKGHKTAFCVLSEDAKAALRAIRLPRRELIFAWHLSDSSFYLHYEKLLAIAKLPTGRKFKPQRVRRSSLTYWHKGGQDATERAKHSSPHTTAQYYLDESLFDTVDPGAVLPRITPRDQGD